MLLHSQVNGLLGNVSVKRIDIRHFDLLAQCQNILNPPCISEMSRVMRKFDFCIDCEKKNRGTDQLFGNRAGDPRLCFRYIDIIQHVGHCIGGNFNINIWA